MTECIDENKLDNIADIWTTNKQASIVNYIGEWIDKERKINKQINASEEEINKRMHFVNI